MVAVITRFAVRFSDLDSPIDSIDWLQFRLALMVKNLLPSLIQQSYESFSWLLLADSEVLARHGKDLKRELGPFGDFVSVGRDTEPSEAVRQYLEQHPHPITARVDSDDMLSPEFLRVAVEHVNPGEWLRFPRGGRLTTETARMFQKYDPSNPFVVFHSLDNRHVLDLPPHPLS